MYIYLIVMEWSSFVIEKSLNNTYICYNIKVNKIEKAKGFFMKYIYLINRKV